ncbi:MAG: hypothetical protein ABI140_21800 [Jatrophihabitantaceae bacterium]
MTAKLFGRTLSAAAAVAVGFALLAMPTSASAATDPNALNVAYDVSGSSTIARTGSVVKLGPSVINVAISSDGSFTGSLPLPPTKTTFKALGLLPTTATVNFVPVGPLTGVLGGPVYNTLTSTANYYLKLTDVSVGGIPAFVGNYCQTILPVKIAVSSPANQDFDIINGGVLSGTYSIGLFANCGLTTAAIDLLIPGTGNTASLQLSNGRLVS